MSKRSGCRGEPVPAPTVVAARALVAKERGRGRIFRSPAPRLVGSPNTPMIGGVGESQRAVAVMKLKVESRFEQAVGLAVGDGRVRPAVRRSALPLTTGTPAASATPSTSESTPSSLRYRSRAQLTTGPVAVVDSDRIRLRRLPSRPRLLYLPQPAEYRGSPVACEVAEASLCKGQSRGVGTTARQTVPMSRARDRVIRCGVGCRGRRSDLSLEAVAGHLDLADQLRLSSSDACVARRAARVFASACSVR
jgi:hypothetical protein